MKSKKGFVQFAALLLNPYIIGLIVLTAVFVVLAPKISLESPLAIINSNCEVKGTLQMKEWCTKEGVNYPASTEDLAFEMDSRTVANSFSRDPISVNTISYFGSRFYMNYAGSGNAGIGRVNIQENFDQLFFPAARISDGTNNLGAQQFLWNGYSFQYYGSAYYGGELEGITTFINEETILSKNKIFTGDKDLEHFFEGRFDSDATIFFRDNIDGHYHGFEIVMPLKCSRFCSTNFEVRFLVVTDQPSIAHEIGSGNYKLIYGNKGKRSTTDYQIILTTKDHESDIVEYFQNSDRLIKQTKESADTWLSYFKQPKYIDSGDVKRQKAYLRNAFLYWMISEKEGSFESGRTNFNDRTILPASFSYNGAFVTDATVGVNGLLDAVKQPYPQVVQNLIKDNIEVFHDHLGSEGGYPGSVRAYFVDDEGTQAYSNACEALKFYENTGDMTWLEKVYPSIKSEAQWRLNNKYSSSEGLYYCGGSECGDGRVNSYSPHINGLYYMYNQCLAQMAQELGQTNDQETFINRANQIASQVDRFWRPEKDFFWDIDFNGNYVDKYPDGVSLGTYHFMTANIPTVTQEMAAGMANDIMDPNRFNTPYMLSDIPVDSPIYDPASSHLWYVGNAWTFTGYMAFIGLKNFGFDQEANLIRDRTFEMVSDYGIPKEYYDSTGGVDKPTGATADYYLWTAGHYISMANTEKYIEYDVEIPVCTPEQEICDGLDNDCDGTIDENCNCIDGDTKQCGTSNIGQCQYGTQTCTSGQWNICEGDIGPTSELEDNIDNDCDGAIDEDFVNSCPDLWDSSCYDSWGPLKIIDFIMMLLDILKTRIGG